MYTKRSDIPIKNTWGVKKRRGQEEAALVGLHATKMFDITEGQEVLDIHSTHRISYFTQVYAPEFHNYDWLCHLATFRCVKKVAK